MGRLLGGGARAQGWGVRSSGRARVLHLARSLDPIGPAGPLNALLRIGGEEFEQRVCLVGEGNESGARAAEGSVLRLGRRRGPGLGLIPRLAAVVQEWDPDILQVWPGCGDWGLLAARVAGAKRTILVQLEGDEGGQGEMGRWGKRLSDWRVTMVVGGGGQAEKMMGRGQGDGWGGVPTCVPMDFSLCGRDEGKRREILSELGLPAEAMLLGVAGELTWDMGLVDVLWTIDQLRCLREDVYLVVMGSGPARLAFERYARLFEVSGRVRFLGECGDLERLLPQLDVYCSAGRTAGVVNGVLAAMGAGLPIAAVDSAWHRALIVAGETGILTPPRARSEFSRACWQLVGDGALRRGMGEGARRRAELHFSAAGTAKRFGEAYRRVLGTG